MAGMEGLRAAVTGGASGIGLAAESERAAIVSTCRHWTGLCSAWLACLIALDATAARWYAPERR